MGAPPRLIDLSLARTVDEARRLTWEAGTDAYMAPEQCIPGSLPIEPAADVWGLGATLFHGAAGYLPFPREPGFDAADVGSRFPQVEVDPLPLPDEVPFPVQEAILACLHPEPEQRPTPRQLVERLEPAIAGLRTQPVLFRRRPGLR